MREKLESCFNCLQALEIKATPNNVSILSGVFDMLREMYHELEGVEDNAEDRAEADHGGRDND